MRIAALRLAATALAVLALVGCRAAPSETNLPADDPSTAALARVDFNLIGTATECPSIADCGYFLELDGENRHERMKLFAGLPPDVGLGEPIPTYDLELEARLAPLAPGAYSATMSSVFYAAAGIAGEPGRERPLANCSTGFIVDPAMRGGIIVMATFSGPGCGGSTQFLDFASQPPYELVCGPIDLVRCRDLAEDNAQAALLRYPRAHVASITFTGLDGDYDLLLDNGIGISMIAN